VDIYYRIYLDMTRGESEGELVISEGRMEEWLMVNG
jgi:hypothetical protein